MSLRNKNILIRPKKKSNHVSGNWPGENFFDHLPARMSQICMRIYSFCVQKNTHTSKKISISNFIPMNLRLFLVLCFKCRLYLKNLIKLIKKSFFAATQVKILFVTRISGNKSIIFFGRIILKDFIKQVQLFLFTLTAA